MLFLGAPFGVQGGNSVMGCRTICPATPANAANEGNYGFAYINPIYRWRPGTILVGDTVPPGRFTRSIKNPTDGHKPIAVKPAPAWVAGLDEHTEAPGTACLSLDVDIDLMVPFTGPTPPPVVDYTWDIIDIDNFPGPVYNFERDLSDSGVELIQYGPGVLSGWDLDVERQVSSPVYTPDLDLSDSGVELIQYGSGVLDGWDTDVEQQRSLPDYATDRDLFDSGVELIQYGPGVLEGWDAEQQQLPSSMIPAAGSDAGQDWTYLIIVPPPVVTQPFDTDAEQQRQVADWTIERETYEPAPFIVYGPGVLQGWDTDADTQPRDERWPAVFDSEEERQWTNVIILPPLITRLFGYDTDADHQLPTTPYTIEAAEHQDRVTLVILPALPPLDLRLEEQQISQTQNLFFNADDQETREGTNFIVLPPAPWVYELLDQLRHEGIGVPAQASDAGQEWTYLVIVPPTVPVQPWDTDTEQQRQAADWSIERETSEPAPFIIYAPGVLTGWDTDAQQQRPIPGVPSAAQHEWTQDWINSVIISIIKRAVALRTGVPHPQVALLRALLRTQAYATATKAVAQVATPPMSAVQVQLVRSLLRRQAYSMSTKTILQVVALGGGIKV